jgi:FkbM family methyltransferase
MVCVGNIHDMDFLILKKLLCKYPLIIDVGANKGQSIKSFKEISPEARIHSFEPNPALADLLAQAAREAGDVEVHFLGLGWQEGTATFYTPQVDGRLYPEETSMYREEFQKDWVSQRLRARGTDLTFCQFEAQVLKGDSFSLRPDLIKIDVEGAEYAVLRGFETTIRAYEPIIFAENSDWRTVTTYLRSLAYLPFMPDPLNENLIPFAGERTNTIYLPRQMQETMKISGLLTPR